MLNATDNAREETTSRRVGPMRQAPAVLFLLTFFAAESRAQAAFVIDVPLTSGKAAVEQTVAAYGGSVSGGDFSPSGWQTTSRDDIIVLDLPPRIDTRHGKLLVEFAGVDAGQPPGFFESYILVSLDSTGAPYKSTKAGLPGIQSLYITYDETNDALFRAKAYFNLGDPGCTDWTRCTAEVATPKGWIRNASDVYSIEQAWEANADSVTFFGNGAKTVKSMDLSATSPGGTIGADQMYLMLNACGGSRNNWCGYYDGPVRGGPLGVMYSRCRLEIFGACGDGSCAEYVEDCGSCPLDCGACSETDAGADGGTKDEGTTDDATLDAGTTDVLTLDVGEDAGAVDSGFDVSFDDAPFDDAQDRSDASVDPTDSGTAEAGPDTGTDSGVADVSAPDHFDYDTLGCGCVTVRVE
jgi:hypothetical protein